MSMIKNKRWFHWLASGAAGAIALIAVAVPLTPAKAQIGIQVGPVGIGVGPYYYGPYPHYYHHYYDGYYDPYWGW